MKWRDPLAWRNKFGRVNCFFKMLKESNGAQIAEFAVALPVLVAFVVGIFDFGTAYTVKQRIAIAARDGARVAANQSSADLSLSTPPSIRAVAKVVEMALEQAKINDCGLGSASPVAGPALTWTYTTGTSCPGNLTLKIERGYTYTTTLAAPFQPAYTIEATRITLSYPYRWQFSKVVGFLSPGATSPGTSQITVTTVMQNIN